MNQEIERKFLVVSDGWREAADSGRACRQGYITGSKEVTIRVRVIGNQGYLTLKGPAHGISRAELEYEIPVTDAEYMLANFCGGGIVAKVRYISVQNGLRWEIDEFSGANQGLIVAELELEHEEQSFSKPDWLGEEVSFDPRYTNAALSRNPFSVW
jgi:CYTH domain-containing protein